MINVSLYRFLLFGNLGDIGFHFTDNDVVRLVGPPDDSILSPIFHVFYGCVQIQYTKAKEIAGLYLLLNHSAYPSGGSAFTIDTWNFHPNMSPAEFTDLLRMERIQYTHISHSVEEPPRFIVNECTYANCASADDQMLWSLAAVNPRLGEIGDD